MVHILPVDSVIISPIITKLAQLQFHISGATPTSVARPPAAHRVMHVNASSSQQTHPFCIATLHAINNHHGWG
jgi:hypothetical protein